jgi:hypothetical protein
MNARNTLLLAFSLIVATLIAPASASALTPPVDVTASKSPKNGYTDEPQSATLKNGKTKLFYWQVKRPESATGDGGIVFDDAATGDNDTGYRIRWFKGKKPKSSRDISSEVKNAGFTFDLALGELRFFTAKVKAVSDDLPLCLGGRRAILTSPITRPRISA